MQKRSERVLELLKGGETLIQERLKALRITKEIQGFGNSISTSSSPSSASSAGSSVFILDSSSTPNSLSSPTSNLTWSESDVHTEDDLSPWVVEGEESRKNFGSPSGNIDIPLRKNGQEEEEDLVRTHIWNSSSFVQETGSLIEDEDEEERKRKGKFSGSFMSGLCSKLGISPRGNGKKFGLVNASSNHDAEIKKKINRQFSVG